MRRRIGFHFSKTIYIIVVVLLFDPLLAGRFDDDLKDCLNRITANIYNDQFEAAEKLIDSLERSDYDGPMALLFRAILYQSQMMTAESDFLEEQFFAVLDTVENYSKSILERGRDSAVAYFCLGHAHAFRSLHNARAGHTWAAIKGGLAARNAYGKGYRIDPAFHDIALGLGSYRYWKTVKTKLINWTPLFKREKDNGIDLLRLAVDSSEISSDAARASLIWIYINEKMYGQAIRLADLMRRKYPYGLTFLWAMGEASFEIGDRRLAADIYETILSRLRNNPGNYYNSIEAAYYLSVCYRKLGEKNPDYRERLTRLREEMRTCPIPEDTRKRQEKKLKRILKEN